MCLRVEEGESILFSGPSRKEEKLNLKYLRRLGEGRRGAQGGWGWSRVRRRSGEHDDDVEDREGVTLLLWTNRQSADWVIAAAAVTTLGS